MTVEPTAFRPDTMGMIDPFGRAITYLRVSVTDRCDLRCVYCMAEDMTFLPKADVLSLEELERLCTAFIRLGTTKIRITGGEPLVRRDVQTLFQRLGGRLGQGLKELTLTTNGTQLTKHADALYAAGVRRVNVSLDTLDPARFTAITRRGRIEQVLDGIAAAKAAGLHVKINAVALKGVNEDEIDDMLAWCGEHGHDLCLIETMPMGDIGGDRTDQYLPLSLVRARLRERWTLQGTNYQTGGPGRLHHADDAQLLRKLQPRAADLHGHAVYVPGPGRRGRFAPGLARRGDRPGAGRGHPPRDHPQAERPRLHHRPPQPGAVRRAAHEPNGGLNFAGTALTGPATK